MSMRIEVVPMTKMSSGTREVGFHVFSDEVLDWPRIEAQLSKEHRSMLNGLGPNRQLHYYPHNPTPEEYAEHGWSFAEFWVWSSITSRSGAVVAPV